MNAVTQSGNAVAQSGARITARRAGFFWDVLHLGGRSLRSIPRDIETMIPALIIPVFFFVINVGALQDLTENIPGGFDYKAFQIPVASLFAVTGLSRANILVLDIQGGYFDRLALTPVNRLAMLMGFMVADVVLAVAMTIPVLILAFIVGVEFASGPVGIVVYLLISAVWALVYNGFPYAIALKTGNPAAVNTSFMIFFPVVFLTPLFVPLELMTGWLETVASYNPVTYLLQGMRSLVTEGWVLEDIIASLIGIGAIGLISVPLASWALLGRVRRR